MNVKAIADVVMTVVPAPLFVLQRWPSQWHVVVVPLKSYKTFLNLDINLT
jgi:hypothetical protein